MSGIVYLSQSDRLLLRSLISCVTANIKKLESSNMESGVISPTLPYTIDSNTYQSYTIITTGVVSINGVSVPEGTYTWTSPNNGTLTGLSLTGTGSAVITTTKKV